MMIYSYIILIVITAVMCLLSPVIGLTIGVVGLIFLIVMQVNGGKK